MDEQQIHRVVAALRRRRVEADAMREASAASLAQLADARDAAQSDDEHDPEGATLSAEWSRLTALVRVASDELTGIDDALARAGAPGFGICVDCGLAIPAERLFVRPEATRCVRCADTAQGGRRF